MSHLLINKHVCMAPLVFQSQGTVQCKLHTINPEIFPLLETMDTPVSIILENNLWHRLDCKIWQTLELVLWMQLSGISNGSCQDSHR